MTNIFQENVQWTEKDGSKLTSTWSWLELGCDLMLINYRYHAGEWINELPVWYSILTLYFNGFLTWVENFSL